MAAGRGTDVAAIERLVFFGTPRFAVPALEALVEAGLRPDLVVTQPPRRAGRGRKLTEPPVAIRARELGLEVVQPLAVRDQEFLARVRRLGPDLAVVVAFGQIFPPALLGIPRLGCLNVHASLLPRWRGAAPIQAAIAAGDDETGVSIQRMEAGLDTGPVFAERRTPIAADETAGELAERLALIGARLLVEVVPAIAAGLVAPAPQDESGASHAPKLGGPAVVTFALAAAVIARRVRAFNPKPGTVLELRGESVKLLRATAVASAPAHAPGTVIGIGPKALRVAAGDGTTLDIDLLQRPGGRPLSGRDLANGLRLRPGDRLD